MGQRYKSATISLLAALALANNDETAYALDPKTGSIRWQYDGLGYSPALAPAVDRDVTYLLTAGGAIVALRESDGAFIKRFELGLIGTYAAPVVVQYRQPPFTPPPRPHTIPARTHRP